MHAVIKKSRSFSDILGITVSLICAIQCAIAPILLSITTFIPTWAHFGHGWLWISFILLVASWSIGRGFLRHHKKSVVLLAGFGMAFLILGTVFEEYLSVISESVVFATGGFLLTFAHWRNYRLEGACSLRSAVKNAKHPLKQDSQNPAKP